MATNVPPVVFTPTGLQVPEESAILAGTLEDMDAAFGGGLNPALNTPQGQLASSTAAIVADANAVFADFVNQIDPDTADGFMQDAIARIYFIDRTPGAPTVVECQCIGAFGTLIPAGSQVQDTSGNIYASLGAATIPISGTVNVQFANIEDGPIPCPADTVTRIYRAIPGWDTVNNAAPGTLGRNVETRADFEARRSASVALNAQGSIQAVQAAVLDVEDVLDAFTTENVTDLTVPFGATNYPLLPHSLLVSVVGGTDEDVANAIFTKKSPGCNMNGNTTVVVTDSVGYSPPFPTYDITFLRPTPLPILFAVEIQDSPDLPADIEALVKASIIATFNGTDGGTRVRIGSNLLASKFYPGIIRIGPEVSLLSVLLGSVTPTLTSQLIGVDQAPTVQESDITVTLI
jgi:uncharacterized phage protein gp47/JayE